MNEQDLKFVESCMITYIILAPFFLFLIIYLEEKRLKKRKRKDRKSSRPKNEADYDTPDLYDNRIEEEFYIEE